MIDSVLKGTGNSRFLKSAVPAGTSWADALAMLQAGTFPIDFNGINNAGFQQVGTPLNKANLLKDATALTLGLTGDVVPNDMFNAMAHAGDLHVWRKTVVTTEPIPEQSAGYNLGSKTNFLIGTPSRSSREPYINVMYANTVSVSNDGTVNISGDSGSISGWYPSNGDSPNYLQMRGKFIKITQFVYLDAPRTVDMDTVYYIPNDATATLPNYGSAYGEFRIEMQKVTGYPYTPATPAGTTTTYPVSTNRNAYQEGDDAKPAGYTLGEVVTGSFSLGTTAGTQTYTYESATSLDVGDDGTVSLQNPSSGSFGTMGGLSPGDNLSIIQTFILGKFVRCTGINTSYVSGAPDTKYPFNVVPSDIVYIPSNANVTKTSNVIYIDRYQPVTGYAAIPANTTIEYLGCLGDKARVQVGSYVGTGTYGSDHPNVLTFDFAPKLVIISGYTSNGYTTVTFVRGASSAGYPANGVNYFSMRLSWNDKKVSWYNPSYDPDEQANKSGYRYDYIAIG
jgi:hypothetical protein